MKERQLIEKWIEELRSELEELDTSREEIDELNFKIEKLRIIEDMIKRSDPKDEPRGTDDIVKKCSDERKWLEEERDEKEEIIIDPDIELEVLFRKQVIKCLDELYSRREGKDE